MKLSRNSQPKPRGPITEQHVNASMGVAYYAALRSAAACIGISGVFGSIIRKFLLSPTGSRSLVIALITHATAPLAALAIMFVTDNIITTTGLFFWEGRQKKATLIFLGLIGALITGWTLNTVLTLILRTIILGIQEIAVLLIFYMNIFFVIFSFHNATNGVLVVHTHANIFVIYLPVNETQSLTTEV